MKIVESCVENSVKQDTAYFAGLPVGAILKYRSSGSVYTKLGKCFWVLIHKDGPIDSTLNCGGYSDLAMSNTINAYDYYPEAKLVLGKKLGD